MPRSKEDEAARKRKERSVATPSVKEDAARSGKLGFCAAFNEALPVQQRLQTLHKVCALAFAFNAAHKQRAPLHSAQRYTVRSDAQRAAFHSAERFTAPSATLREALHSAQHCTPPTLCCIARSIAQLRTLHSTEHSEPRQGRMQQPIHRLRIGGCCAFFVRLSP